MAVSEIRYKTVCAKETAFTGWALWPELAPCRPSYPNIYLSELGANIPGIIRRGRTMTRHRHQTERSALTTRSGWLICSDYQYCTAEIVSRSVIEYQRKRTSPIYLKALWWWWLCLTCDAPAAGWGSCDWCPSAWLLSNPSPDEYYSDADVCLLMGGDLFISGKHHTIQFWPLS